MMDRWSSIAELAETGADIPDGGPTALDKMPYEDELRKLSIRIQKDVRRIKAIGTELRNLLKEASLDNNLGDALWEREYGLGWVLDDDFLLRVDELVERWNSAKPAVYCVSCDEAQSGSYAKHMKNGVCDVCQRWGRRK